MDKRLIADRFARALPTYDKQAVVQKQVAITLVDCLAGSVGEGRRVVELGCGTGLYSRLLLERLKPSVLWLNDLAPESEQYVAPLLGENVWFVHGDAEQFVIPSGMDVITACSVLQWFDDVPRFFRRCANALSAGGILALSTYLPGTLPELAHLTGQGLDYVKSEDILAMLYSDFDVVVQQNETITAAFPTPMHVLHHLKQTGVTGTGGLGWTPHRLEIFCAEYKRLYSNSDGNVSLTYKPFYVVATKKEV